MSYIVPNFHSISETNFTFDSTDSQFSLSTQLDFNGSAFHNNISVKNNKTTDYYTLRPTLPYFVNQNRNQNSLESKNCLIYCQNKNLLLSSFRNKIIGLNIEEIEDKNVSEKHFYSYDKSIDLKTFRFRTKKIFDLFNFENDLENIFELKLNTYENSNELTTISRNEINFLKFESNDKMDYKLRSFQEICELQDNEKFEIIDRNPFIREEVLISLETNNSVFNFDFETEKIIWCSESHYQLVSDSKQIGFNWSQMHRKMFFYGQNDKILLFDTRIDENCANVLYTKGGHNLYEWEYFYAICPSKLNDYQLYIASEYHVFVIDIRYPKENVRLFLKNFYFK
jgi:hypothetical protein